MEQPQGDKFEATRGLRHRFVTISIKSDILKKVILTMITFLIVSVAAVFAQNPVPQPDTLQDPVQEGDPAVRILPPAMDYVS